MDQYSCFMSSLINHLFMELSIKIKPVVPYNHQSLQAEYGIKSYYIDQAAYRFWSVVAKILALHYV